jgi:hypothetical protein
MLAISHANIEEIEWDAGEVEQGKDVYRTKTATPVQVRTRSQIERMFGGRTLVEPGLAYLPVWHPDPTRPSEFEDNPKACGCLGAIARIA